MTLDKLACWKLPMILICPLQLLFLLLLLPTLQPERHRTHTDSEACKPDGQLRNGGESKTSQAGCCRPSERPLVIPLPPGLRKAQEGWEPPTEAQIEQSIFLHFSDTVPQKLDSGTKPRPRTPYRRVFLGTGLVSETERK